MQPTRELERRIVTVLFADLVGFTPLSEGLDPEDVATIQDAYFAAVRDVMQRHGGQLEKFIGDAAMAVFGLPRSRDDDAERAISAGLALIAAVESLGAQLGLEEGRLQVRVGVNTGEVVAAESGPDVGRVTGDTVNVAARLQAAAQPSQVLVGELTAFGVAATVELLPVEPLTLKGKAAPVRAAIARGLLPQPDRSRAMGALSAPLVGRQDELAQLAVSLAPDPGARSWLVVAPPGVGKSRLLAELASAAAPSAAVWRAQVRVGGASPFEPVAQLLLAALETGGGQPDLVRSALLARLASASVIEARAVVLVDRTMTLVQPLPDVGRQAADRDDQFAAWIETFGALERTGPHDRSLWIVEDLHWASPDLIAFLSAAAGTNGSRAMVCSARPALLHDPRADALLAGFSRLELEPLAAPDAATLVRRLVGGRLPKELVEQIATQSDGNALFIEELLRSWIGAGLLVDEPGGGWRLASDPKELALPTTVQAIYAGQLDDLPTSARQLARRASVAGRRFLRQSLPALQLDDAAALDDLRSRALVIGPRPVLLGDAFAYRHALLRDAGYASLARLERSDLHARLARWLEATAAERSRLIGAEIAQHYLDALAAMPQLAQVLPSGTRRDELATSAAIWLDRAAEQALRTAAPLTAAEQLRRAIELTPDDDLSALARRWLALAEAIGFSGGTKEALAALDRSIELFEPLLDAPAADAGSRDGYARAVSLRGKLRIEQLQFREAEAAATAALARLGEEVDDLAAARVRYLRAWARVAYSPMEDVAEDLIRVQAIAGVAGERQLELDAASMLDEIRIERGQITAQEFMDGRERVVELARSIGQPRLAGAALRTVAVMGVEYGRADVFERLAEAVELAQAHALTEEVAWASYAATEVQFVLGDWDAAWRSGLEALEIAEAHDYHRPIVRTWSVLTAMAHAQGRVAELERAHDWFDPRRAMFPDSPFGRIMHGAVDVRAAARGLRESFVSDASLLDGFSEAPGLPSWLAAAEEIVGECWIDGQQLDLATRAVELLRRWQAMTSPLGLASIDLLDARLRLALGDSPAAISLAREALARATSIGAAWWQVRALRLLAAQDAATADELDRAQRLAAQLSLERRVSDGAVTSGTG